MFPALYCLNKQHNDNINPRYHRANDTSILTVKQLYEKAFHAGREVQIIEHSGHEVDGRAIWSELERSTKQLKDQPLIYHDEILNYNLNVSLSFFHCNSW